MAKLIGLSKPDRRELGFYPLRFESDLLEPTDDQVIGAVYGDRDEA